MMTVKDINHFVPYHLYLSNNKYQLIKMATQMGNDRVPSLSGGYVDRALTRVMFSFSLRIYLIYKSDRKQSNSHSSILLLNMYDHKVKITHFKECG